MAVKTSAVSGKVYYTYAADGTKLQTRHLNGLSMVPVIFGNTVSDALLPTKKTTDYVGNIVYENGSLKRILIDGGYIEGGVYNYYLKDHLGNNRVVLNGEGAVLQQTTYYPFGMAFATNTVAEHDKQPYKFGGKGLDRQNGLNMYDFSARQYEPAIGRFTTQDPLAEKYYSISPYAYCSNNPITRIDPTGMDIWEIDKYGYVVKQTKDREQDAFYLVDAEGKRMNGEGASISFAYGTVKSVSNESIEHNGTTLQMTMFNISGTDNASKLFETMSNAREVEWSNSKVEKNGLAQNIVGTTHLDGRDAVGGYLIQKGYIMKSHVHNHMTPDISQNDKKFNRNSSSETYIYRNNGYVDPQYIKYNYNGIVIDINDTKQRQTQWINYINR